MAARNGVRFKSSDIWDVPEDHLRYEVIDGELFVTPAPGSAHQYCIGELFFILRGWIGPRNLGVLYVAPIGVELGDEDGVEPDMVYLGFMLLGFMLRTRELAAIELRRDAAQMGGIQDLQFNPPEPGAPYGTDRNREWRGRLLIGEVDDSNNYALGGAAGQAGLFGTAGRGGRLCAMVPAARGRPDGAFRKETLETFIARRATCPGALARSAGTRCCRRRPAAG